MARTASRADSPRRTERVPKARINWPSPRWLWISLFARKWIVRGQAVLQHDGFDLKPSGTDTVRLNGMVKVQPFKYTTISASYSVYRMHGTRPNTTTPLDGISLWQASGRPTFDPPTATIHIGGRSLPNQAVATLPNYFSGTNSLLEL